MPPAISVIITTYNRAEHFLPRAIYSVLSQTFRDFELIVVDDCSIDDTAKVVREWRLGDARIKYACTHQNTAYQSKPKNIGLRMAEGEWIAYLDDDNEWHPTHLERLHTAIGGADFAYCGRTYANDDVYPQSNPLCLGHLVPFNLVPWDPERTAFDPWIDTSDILHRKDAILRIGGWDENSRRAADWNLVQRVAKAGLKVVFLPEVLTTYYWHTANIGRVPLGRPAVWSLTKNRLYDVQRSFASLWECAGIPFDHYVLDQGSTDGTAEWLTDQAAPGPRQRIAYLRLEPDNVGISRGSNHLLDVLLPGGIHSWICKMDSDIILQTPLIFERLAQRWLPKHVLSPHILGLVDHPGGAPRTAREPLRRLGYAKHLGGAFNFAPIDAWTDFGRWNVPAPAHGFQDAEFSTRLRDKGWKLAYVEDILARHLRNVDPATRAAERKRVV